MSRAIPLWLTSTIAFVVALVALDRLGSPSAGVDSASGEPSGAAVFTFLLMVVMAVLMLCTLIPAIRFTISEESARHEAGKRGLGGAGITSVVASIALVAATVGYILYTGFFYKDSYER